MFWYAARVFHTYKLIVFVRTLHVASCSHSLWADLGILHLVTAAYVCVLCLHGIVEQERGGSVGLIGTMCSLALLSCRSSPSLAQ